MEDIRGRGGNQQKSNNYGTTFDFSNLNLNKYKGLDAMAPPNYPEIPNCVLKMG